VYVCQHQGVTFLLGDCSESEAAAIAIKVHGFHGKYFQNCFVSHGKMTSGDPSDVEAECYVGLAPSSPRLGTAAIVTYGHSLYRLSTVCVTCIFCDKFVTLWFHFLPCV
jgi:hypothetical protein